MILSGRTGAIGIVWGLRMCEHRSRYLGRNSLLGGSSYILIKKWCSWYRAGRLRIDGIVGIYLVSDFDYSYASNSFLVISSSFLIMLV